MRRGLRPVRQRHQVEGVAAVEHRQASEGFPAGSTMAAGFEVGDHRLCDPGPLRRLGLGQPGHGAGVLKRCGLFRHGDICIALPHCCQALSLPYRTIFSVSL